MRNKILLIVFAVILIAGAVSVSAIASFSTTQYSQPSFQTSYSAAELGTYWPIFEDMEKGECRERQDIILNVAPFGCQPVVVKSDLLADQNVPVFCQIDALKINPLIDVREIRNIRFVGQEYPDEVAGIGFHPAKSALSSRNDRFMGSPLLTNIGYVVVVLRRNENESSLPDFVEVDLSAQIDYDGGNALGIGRAEFRLKEMSDAEWAVEKNKQSFWNGRYFVRLESADAERATVSLYRGNTKISSVTVEEGDLSREIYFPGAYCMAAVQIAYDGFEADDDKAKIEVSDDRGTDVFEVYDGSKFLNGKCTVIDIEIDASTETGKVSVRCGGERFDLELKVAGEEEDEEAEKTKREIKKEKFRKAIDDVVNLGMDAVEAIEGVGYDEEEDKGLLNDSDLKGNADKYKNALKAYEDIADSYPAERPEDSEVEGYDTYGELALFRAIELAREYGQQNDEARLLTKMIENYPESERINQYLSSLGELYEIDSSKASVAVELDNRFRVIRLAKLIKSKARPSIDYVLDRIPGSMEYKDIEEFEGEVGDKAVNSVFSFSDISGVGGLAGLAGRKVKIDYKCEEGDRWKSTLALKEGESELICGKVLRINKINIEESAKIRIVPKVRGTTSESNLSVKIGIEKRAIQLTPEKVDEKVRKLNETIEKWEGISNRLNGTIESLQKACVTTSLILTFKNFLTGMGGKSIARQRVMSGDEGWTNWCRDRVPSEYPTLDACYLAKADDIERDVDKTAEAIKRVNDQISGFEEGATTTSSVFGKSVDDEKVKRDLARAVREKYGDEVIGPKGEKVNDILAAGNLDAVSLSEVRDLYMNLERQSAGGLTDVGNENVGDYLKDSAARILDNVRLVSELEKTEEGYAKPFVGSEGQLKTVADVVPVESVPSNIRGSLRDATHSATLATAAGTYILGLAKSDSGLYTTTSAVNKDNPSDVKGGDALTEFLRRNGVGVIRASNTISYNNKMVKPEVRYFETEPYKGMPAIVPVEKNMGWYAATRQQLPALGGIGAFDASGRVTSFWLCNVGDDKRVGFNEGLGDDVCQLINLNTGQPLGVFPGLSELRAKELVNKAVKAINDAARQYGNKVVNVGGESYSVGSPAVDIPGTQCQDFMSPKECNLLFNLCDPVVCPSSRCNLGGQYHVPNVIQSGIIGSTLLCLPNIREGIFVPVCLTGIKAGIDGYLSIVKSYQSCLNENIETGRMVGICDQRYSFFICDFFWREVGPIANTLLPRLFEAIAGQGGRGGGEYLTVQGAWDNAKNSLNQFTQFYGVNSAQAFKVTAFEELFKNEACDAYISTSVPDAFDSAFTEPDSPPQFHAWFSSATFSTATAPATAQYKVFYHVFAGNSQGTFYRVYLKNPPESAFYVIPETVNVATGFIAKGESASESRDFTAPEGYKELCVNVNGQEECGFKQVSTSLALNYLRDSYVSEQVAESNIQSEQACISGTRSLSALAAGGGLQEVAEEALLPEVYNRGVVRICSSANPGSSTDPSRWIEVGNCGDPKIKCWLDKNSVSDAITDNNVGLMNQTLSELDDLNRVNLEREGLLSSDVSAKIKEIDKAKNELDGKDATRVNVVLNLIDATLDKTIFNYHKAKLLFLKAEVLEKVLRGAGAVSVSGEVVEVSAPSEEEVKAIEEEEGVAEEEAVDEEPHVEEPAEATYKLTLSENYDSKKKLNILFGDEETGLYAEGSSIRSLDDVRVGIVTESGIVRLISNYRGTEIPECLFDLLDFQSVEEGNSEIILSKSEEEIAKIDDCYFLIFD